MADHGEVQYSTADGNDYAEHEGTYTGFIHFSFVGSLYVINTILGLGIVGLTSHWLVGAVIIFVVGLAGAIHSIATGTRGASIAALIISLLAFASSTMN
jgi:hypothetical protein